MRFASDRQASYAQGRPLKDRAAALTIAIAVNVLLLLMLLHLASSPPKPPPPSGALVAVALPGDVPVASKATTKAKRASGGAAHRAPTPATKPVSPPPVVPPTPPMPSKAPPLNLLAVTKEELDATDRALGASHDRTAANGDGAGSGNGSGSGSGAGGAPAMGRDHLYNAEWYRKPTQAEMQTYLPHSLAVTSWGEIACRTIPNYGVEDCAELDESPAGSGMSRALREAAWQFKVRPPRVGGKSLVGAWVRIRYTLVIGGHDDADEARHAGG